ncbi:MAG: GNAT family N-acetyltransferase [Verrucomicrobia bacterium]|nr:GNAT family N-acetyltransferase [Verrucomicrobiota bacterium]
MEVIRYSDPGVLRAKIETRLMEHEAVNNLFLGLLKRFSENSSLQEKEHLWFSVEDQGDIKLAGWRTPPFPFGLWSPKKDFETAVNYLIDYLIAEELEVPGIVAGISLAETFTAVATSRMNVEKYFTMNQGIYECREVDQSLLGNGTIRPVQQEELELLTDWMIEFYKESLNQEPLRSETREKLTGEIAKRTYFFYEEDGTILSTAATTRPTINGITVNMVYTPPEYRKKGYATTSVALLTQKLLDANWKFTALFTDLDNPTSNNIYQKIGYQKVGESRDIRFKPVVKT